MTTADEILVRLREIGPLTVPDLQKMLKKDRETVRRGINTLIKSGAIKQVMTKTMVHRNGIMIYFLPESRTADVDEKVSRVKESKRAGRLGSD